jgi:beta-lactamase superfamily II metal-dependent hydrolase
MPHHGERASNTADLLDAVCPKIAVITDSYKDPASKKTLKLLDKVDAETYCTSYDGTVVIESNGTGSYQVRTEAE